MNLARGLPLVALLALHCAARTPAPARDQQAAAPEPARRALHGRVTFDARTLTPQGYSAAVETRPARYVTVEARSAQGVAVASTRTDERGAYTLEAPATAATLVAAASAVTPGAQRLEVDSDPMGQLPYALEVPLAVDAREVNVHATLAEPWALGGAFHALDTLVRGATAVERWTRRALPPLFVIWRHASGLDWTYFRGERPARSGRFALELMGGEAGRLETSDADEHDEFIVLHEYGHFVFDQLSTSSSIGGRHPGDVLTDPGVAWEEGRATWFACVVLGDARYRDAVGIAPAGTLRQDDDIEQLPPGALRGVGSQRSVEEILWDLSDGPRADGAESLSDRDNDGINVGPERVLAAMLRMRAQAGPPAYITSFLQHLARSGAVPAATLSALLRSPVAHGFELPPADRPAPWPAALAPGATARGKIDGVSDPAPSGGRAHPINGLDAVRTYVAVVPAGATLHARLRIAGTGTPADRSDLELELRDDRAELLARSRSDGPTEVLSRAVAPGRYLLYVRDAGNGNTADYELSYRLEPARP